MTAVQQIRCSNCGHHAERHKIPDRALTRTQCEFCDYLLVTCDRTGKVIEAYAPGLPVNRLQAVS